MAGVSEDRDRVNTGIAYVGCGFVADFYQSCLPNTRGCVKVCGGYDRDSARLAQFTQFHGVPAYGSLEAVLADPDVAIVVNLTNPDQHYTVSKTCLEAGKHVYSEKPLAMDLGEARELVDLAAARGLHIAAAPASALGEAAQTLWKAVREGLIGPPRLVYAEIDDGLVHRIGCENWRSVSGAPWPAEDEFATGCTMEHAGYALSWLAALFGPVRRVVSFASLLFPDKGPFTPPDYATPDFSVGCLEFDGGVVARLTNSVIAPHDHHLRLFGEKGELRVQEIWDFEGAVTFRPVLESRAERYVEKKTGMRRVRKIPPVRRRKVASAPNGANMDFMRGLTEMAEALDAGRAPRLAGDFALHITEASLALQYPDRFGSDYRMTSTFDPMEPMPWAR